MQELKLFKKKNEKQLKEELEKPEEELKKIQNKSRLLYNQSESDEQKVSDSYYSSLAEKIGAVILIGVSLFYFGEDLASWSWWGWLLFILFLAVPLGYISLFVAAIFFWILGELLDKYGRYRANRSNNRWRENYKLLEQQENECKKIREKYDNLEEEADKDIESIILIKKKLREMDNCLPKVSEAFAHYLKKQSNGIAHEIQKSIEKKYYKLTQKYYEGFQEEYIRQDVAYYILNKFPENIVFSDELPKHIANQDKKLNEIKKKLDIIADCIPPTASH